jgi:hypothetical protein
MHSVIIIQVASVLPVEPVGVLDRGYGPCNSGKS